MTRGAFIVIEGLDRSGKTTQTELLATRLTTNGVSVARRKFPGTSERPTAYTATTHTHTPLSPYQIARLARAR